MPPFCAWLIGLTITLLTGSAARASEAALVFRVASESIAVITTDTGALGSAVAYTTFKSPPGTELLTNCHVLAGATTLRVSHRGRVAAAFFLYGDAKLDICAIGTTMMLPEVKHTRNFFDVQVGEAVYAVGSPQGLELSITSGIVSQKRGTPFLPPMLIQTTAPISRGSSGGGLFDALGRLVGITTFSLKDSQGLNFAISINMVSGLVSSPSARTLEDLK